MLYARGSLRGQSLSIALAKMLGTALFSLVYFRSFAYQKSLSFRRLDDLPIVTISIFWRSFSAPPSWYTT